MSGELVVLDDVGFQSVPAAEAIDTPADAFACESRCVLVGDDGEQIEQVIRGLQSDVFSARAAFFGRQKLSNEAGGTLRREGEALALFPGGENLVFALLGGSTLTKGEIDGRLRAARFVERLGAVEELRFDTARCEVGCLPGKLGEAAASVCGIDGIAVGFDELWAAAAKFGL